MNRSSEIMLRAMAELLRRCYRKDTHLPDNAEKLVEVSATMIRAGVDALKEETYATPVEELVDLIYSAMEYQRRREAASPTRS